MKEKTRKVVAKVVASLNAAYFINIQQITFTEKVSYNKGFSKSFSKGFTTPIY